MAVLVTGAGGFVGRHLVGQLLQHGHEIVALDKSLKELPVKSDLIRIEGDLTDGTMLDEALSHHVTSIIHLAALPGGAAESDSALSFEVNVAGTAALMRRAAEQLNCPRFVFSSSIAVLGDPLPRDGVDDDTACTPTLTYGIHKQMTETLLEGMTRRGELDGVALRLPGIVARPEGNTGLKSAFMSDVFHALLAKQPFVSPVSAEAKCWLMSNAQISNCLEHALNAPVGRLKDRRTLTLPAVHVSMKELVDEIAAQTGAVPETVSYESDAKLEAAFGKYPALQASAAEQAGFRADSDVIALVQNALLTL